MITEKTLSLYLHWLFHLGKQYSLSEVIKRLKAGLAIDINRHLKRKGSIWQRGFYDHTMRQNEDIKKISHYYCCYHLKYWNSKIKPHIIP